MTRRPSSVTSLDVALLRALARERSVVAASRRIGISRDRATYRLGRLRRAFGGAVVTGERGGRAHGGSRLTPLGDRIVRGGFDSVELLNSRPVTPLSQPNRLDGIYHRSDAPEVWVEPNLHLRVAFRAEEREPVSVLLDPEAILVARRRFPSSARNVLAGQVEAVRGKTGPLDRTLLVRVGAARLRVAVTEEPIRQLHLRRGARVWLYVKATALRRVERRSRATRGSLPR
ncbi:MAG: TOBE domain-containing protein [Thermoplasmata archaeon]|jgi:molybdate transport repressor ModE-like protein/molybdopterin-binding protein